MNCLTLFFSFLSTDFDKTSGLFGVGDENLWLKLACLLTFGVAGAQLRRRSQHGLQVDC